jgi:hypothetical protein
MTVDGEKLLRELRRLGETEVFVGFQHGTKHKKSKEADVLDIAMWNELGTSNGIPSRPFIRDTYDMNEAAIAKFTETMVARVTNGEMEIPQAASALGIYVVSLMQTQIDNGAYKPNSKKTRRRKRSDQPLIDTGMMKQSIRAVVRKKGSGEE